MNDTKKEYFIVTREWFEGQQEPLENWKELTPALEEKMSASLIIVRLV